MDWLTLLFGVAMGFSGGMLFVQVFSVHRLERDIVRMSETVVQLRREGFVSYPDLERVQKIEYPEVRED